MYFRKEACTKVSNCRNEGEKNTILTFASMNHEIFMQRCFQLAQNGEGHVAPNPLVGAVIVHEGKIIGEGFHARYGEAHAEVMAIRNCKHPELLPHSTLYVNLEPCSHFGKTPPCADLILSHHIPSVVICNTDPFPEVSGRGIAKLKAGGVKVIQGICEQEGLLLNRRFFTFHTLKRPYILLKWAQSKDGFIDGTHAQPIKITQTTSDVKVHQWRTEETAIMIGFNTAKKDNPSLTARLYPGKNPLRLVWDPKLELPSHLQIFQDGNPTWVFTDSQEGQKGNVRYLKSENMEAILNRLHKEKIQSILVEGGAALLNTFIRQGYGDELRILTGNCLIKEGIKAPEHEAFQLLSEETIGADSIHYYTRKKA